MKSSDPSEVPDFPVLVAPVLSSPGVLPCSVSTGGAVGAPFPASLRPVSPGYGALVPVVVVADDPVVPDTCQGLVKRGLTTPVVPALPAVKLVGNGVLIMPVVKASLGRVRVVPIVSLLDVVIPGMNVAVPELIVDNGIAVVVLNMEVAVVVETVTVAFSEPVSMHSNSPAMQ